MLLALCLENFCFISRHRDVLLCSSRKPGVLDIGLWSIWVYYLWGSKLLIKVIDQSPFIWLSNYDNTICWKTAFFTIVALNFYQKRISHIHADLFLSYLLHSFASFFCLDANTSVLISCFRRKYNQRNGGPHFFHVVGTSTIYSLGNI